MTYDCKYRVQIQDQRTGQIVAEVIREHLYHAWKSMTEFQADFPMPDYIVSVTEVR